MLTPQQRYLRFAGSGLLDLFLFPPTARFLENEGRGTADRQSLRDGLPAAGGSREPAKLLSLASFCAMEWI